jgi:secreted trypsin-like serine protease
MELTNSGQPQLFKFQSNNEGNDMTITQTKQTKDSPRKNISNAAQPMTSKRSHTNTYRSPNGINPSSTLHANPTPQIDHQKQANNSHNQTNVTGINL